MLKAKLPKIFIFCSNKMSNRAMLSGEGNENDEKTEIGQISKKQLCTCSTFSLYISLPLFCMTTTWNFQKLPGYTFYGGNVVRVHIFSPRWPLAFLISHRRYKNFMLFLQQKMSPWIFLSCCRSFSRWASLAYRLTFSFSLSFSFSIFQIWGHDN